MWVWLPKNYSLVYALRANHPWKSKQLTKWLRSSKVLHKRRLSKFTCLYMPICQFYFFKDKFIITFTFLEWLIQFISISVFVGNFSHLDFFEPKPLNQDYQMNKSNHKRVIITFLRKKFIIFFFSEVIMQYFPGSSNLMPSQFL